MRDQLFSYKVNELSKTETMIKTAEQFIQVFKYKEAAAIYLEITKTYPNNKVIWETLGYCYQRLEWWGKASSAFFKAHSLDMRDLNIIFNIGVTAYEQNNFRLAVEWFDLVLKRQPENIDILNNIACYLIKMKELNKAIFCLQKAESVLGDDETILSNLAIAYGKNKNWSKAIFYFEKFFMKKPRDPAMINNLASCLMESGRYQLALRCLNRAISQEEHNLSFLFNKAQCLIYMRECKEAKSVLQAAMKISPNNSVGLYLLGQVYEELQEETTDLSYYNQAWGLV